MLIRNADGSVSILFAVMMIILFGVAGLAIDIARAYDEKNKFQAAADAAVLSAAAAVNNYITKNGISESEDIQEVAFSTAQKYFTSNRLTNRMNAGAPTISVEMKLGRPNIKLAFTGEVNSALARVVGVKSMPFKVTASALASGPAYVNVYLMIDTSGSMAIGASDADQQVLIANTGCAFACHDQVPINGYPDAYAYALGTGVTLRLAAVRSGIKSLLDKIDGLDPSHSYVRTAVYEFNNNLTNLAALTTDTADVRANLPLDPAISNETEGATHFKENIGQVISAIGPGGDGTSADKAIKLLIIATDGAQDPGRYWTGDVAAQAEVDAFDMSFCEPLKAGGVNVGIIHTPYTPFPGESGYEMTLGQPSQRGGPGTRADDIAPAFKTCAGNRYVLANDATAITGSFLKIFNSLQGIYLTN